MESPRTTVTNGDYLDEGDYGENYMITLSRDLVIYPVIYIIYLAYLPKT